MKKLFHALLLSTGLLAIASCNDSQSYADQVKQERSAINAYIAKHRIKVISEAQFLANGEKTDTTEREFVLFESSGVYMQIINKGCGKKIEKGEKADVLCRFSEWNLLKDTLQLSSFDPRFSGWVDKMSVTNTSGTFTATFSGTSGLMYRAYQRTSGTSVPSGWLTPLRYIKVGRPATKKDTLAHVRLIVPHDRGHGAASSSVTPYLYEITYQRR